MQGTYLGDAISQRWAGQLGESWLAPKPRCRFPPYLIIPVSKMAQSPMTMTNQKSED